MSCSGCSSADGDFRPCGMLRRSCMTAAAMIGKRSRVLQINGFGDDDARLFGCAFIYCQDILAQDADEENLYGAQQQECNHNLGNPERVAVPEKKLADENIGGVNETEYADNQPYKGGDAH